MDARGGEVQRTGGRQVVVAGADLRLAELTRVPAGGRDALAQRLSKHDTNPRISLRDSPTRLPTGVEPASSPFHRTIVQSGLRERSI